MLNSKASIPFTLWITGLSGAGKSTLAQGIHKTISPKIACYVLDGDYLRSGINQDLGFSEIDRLENIRRTAEIARILNQAGVTAICSLISPMNVHRELARTIIGKAHFLEIYLSTPLAVCEARDPKGLYKKARSGEIPSFTGISAIYEPPASPDMRLDTSGISIESAIHQITTHIEIFQACR